MTTSITFCCRIFISTSPPLTRSCVIAAWTSASATFWARFPSRQRDALPGGRNGKPRHLIRSSRQCERSNQSVHRLRHFLCGGKVKCVDGDESADAVGWGECHVAEDTLQAPGFLQNQRVRGRRHHDHPPETHRIHAAG